MSLCNTEKGLRGLATDLLLNLQTRAQEPPTSIH